MKTLKLWKRKSCAIILFIVLVSGVFPRITAIAQDSEAAAKYESQFKILLLMRHLNNLLNEGKYQEAIPVAEMSLSLTEKVYGAEHIFTTKTLNDLAFIHSELENYAKANALYKRAYLTLQKEYGDNHITIAVNLKNQAVLWYLQGDYEQAEPLYVRSLEIVLQNKGAIGLEPDTTQKILQDIYATIGLQNSESGGSEDEMVNSIYDDLATIYYKQNRVKEAAEMYEHVFEYEKRTQGIFHPDVVTLLNNLGLLYQQIGKYSVAESYLKQSLEGNILRFGANSPEVANNLNNLGILYSELKRLDDAETFIKKALSIWQNTYGLNNVNVAKCMQHLATVYSEQKRFCEADSLYEKGLAIHETLLGPNHPEIAIKLKNFARHNLYKNRFGQARALYERALKILMLHNLEDHIHFAAILSDLGMIARKEENYIESLTYYNKAHIICQEKVGENSPNSIYTLSQIAELEVILGSYTDAFSKLKKVFEAEQYLIQNVFPAASEREKLNYMETVNNDFYKFINLYSQYLYDSKEAMKIVINSILNRKGMVLDKLSQEKKSNIHLNNPKAVHLMSVLSELSSEIATLTIRGNIDNRTQEKILRLEKDKKDMEKQLSELGSQNHSLTDTVVAVDYQNIAKKLPGESVLLEYIRFPVYNFRTSKIQENRYVVFIVFGDSRRQPELIDLGDAIQIDEAISNYRKKVSVAAKSIDQTSETNAESLLFEKSHLLYKLVFKPVEDRIKNAKTIFLAPDGKLNFIPFGVFQTDQKHYLIERYQFNYLSCGRDLLTMNTQSPRNTGVVILSNPNFDHCSPITAQNDSNKGSENANNSLPDNKFRTFDLGGIKWSPLPNTKLEAESISEIFSHRNIKNYSWENATEDRFKQIDGASIIHIATHGFFLENRTDTENSVSLLHNRGFQIAENTPFNLKMTIENPLLRSGIVLSGANQIGQPNRPPNVEDGILTAFEISGTNLLGTDLVVLSACETGLGENHQGEGVFGLRRAFQLAGARTIVMSLWKVPDKETQELMVDFYQNLNAGLKKPQALRKAQLELINKRRDRIGVAHPFFWGAFICLGAEN